MLFVCLFVDLEPFGVNDSIQWNDQLEGEKKKEEEKQIVGCLYEKRKK